jgi:hypothetical protein
LEELRWKLNEEEFIDASFQDVGIDVHSLSTAAEEVDGHMKQDAKAKMVFLSEFAKVNKAPCIEVEIDKSHDDWEADSILTDCYSLDDNYYFDHPDLFDYSDVDEEEE